MAFLDNNYLLENETGKSLFNQVKDLPVVDAHNHGDVQEIVENKGWVDIWEVEGATDHYVWELMRKRGIPENKITGDAPNKEKWLALAKIFPEVAGNPTYEWIHLDLKRRFGIEEVISEHTAELIWEKTCAALDTPEMKPQRLLKEMNVKIMCTTDDPISDLKYHQQAKEEVSGVKILPTWRPDKAMNLDKEIWKGFIDELGQIYDEDVSGVSGLVKALQKSHDLFNENGCVASDHGVYEPYSHPVTEDRAAEIHQKAYQGQDLSLDEIKDYKAFMLMEFGKMNEKNNWVTQIHIGAVRDYRDVLYNQLGADSGGDLSTQNIEIVNNIRNLLNVFDGKMEIVLYCLDPTHYPTLSSLSRAFPNVSLGAAWWFTDSPYGMEQQLKIYGTVDLLANFAAMVTDSRKLISYGSRTEMFRRVMCNFLGNMVEKGQMPEEAAVKLAAGISYYQPLNLFFQ